MNVLLITATFPPMKSGGAELAFWLCQHLADSGSGVHVVTSQIEGIKVDPRVRVHPVMRRWSWSEMPHLLRVARRCDPDVVNLHFTGPIYNYHPMVTFMPTILKRLIPNVRVVTNIECPDGARIDALPWASRAVWEVVARLVRPRDVDHYYGTLLRDSDRIVVLSDTHRLSLSQHLPGVSDKCVLNPPPPAITMSAEKCGTARCRGRKMLGVSDGEFLISYFGYIYPRKGVETLFKALALVAQQRVNVRLVMIGSGNEVILRECGRPNYVEELKCLSEELGIADRIIWTGYYPSDSDCASLYLRGTDMCVLPFDSGVYLNNSSFTASAAHGLPIVTTRGEVLEPQFVDGENVLLCPPGDPEALAAAIVSLIDEPALRQHLSKGALEMAREWFCDGKVMERTIEAFTGA
jgi:polysaccharide biosynthesis protein PslF